VVTLMSVTHLSPTRTVQAGDDHPGRKTVRDRQRGAVHRHREQGIPAVHDGLDRRA